MENSLHHIIKDYCQLAKYHMKLAHIMRNHNRFMTSLILCHSALMAMIRALFIYENRTLPSSELTLVDLLQLLHTDYNPGLEIVVFVGKLNFVIYEDQQSLEVVKEEDMDRLIKRTEEVLRELCGRM
ncbi:HEPN domain-containing protein [Paenibacillus sp. EZ-K15]|uniref:HEPN domain-containing protein n=1 Tax=Paenibacillus sp. EZ-K15 TaxID=2044275 RepID=UPI000BF9E29B|nr:HEPN domain-containing protein [Paenibacillus sp. EZ-K15]